MMKILREYHKSGTHSRRMYTDTCGQASMFYYTYFSGKIFEACSQFKGSLYNVLKFIQRFVALQLNFKKVF